MYTRAERLFLDAATRLYTNMRSLWPIGRLAQTEVDSAPVVTRYADAVARE